MTYEMAIDLFLFLGPFSRFSTLLFSELFPEGEGLPAVAVLLSANAIGAEHCISLLVRLQELEYS